MILPTKHVRSDRALLGVGADVLVLLREPMTASKLWDEIRSRRSATVSSPMVDYRWFVLTLDLLYLMGAIDLTHGTIRRIAT